MDQVTSKKWDAHELSVAACMVALPLTVRYDVGKPQEVEQGDEWPCQNANLLDCFLEEGEQ